jgi:TonB family protein
MRFLGLPVLVALALGPGVGDSTPERQSSAAAGAIELERLGEFLNWAHPAGDGCESPGDVAIVQTWDGGLRASYRIVCGSSSRALEGVFQVREQVRDKEGVWQVAAGFEADAPRIEAALGPPRATAPPAGLAPPPPNTGALSPDSPLRFVAPPEATIETTPDYPEEAGRARLIGEAHVELLVQISPEGAPLRARPLRGPDPDLGMRRAAIDAVLRWRFEPARLGGEPVTYYRRVDLTFGGLPPESRDWVHRALFHVEAIVSDDELVVQEALRRVKAGEPFGTVAAQAIGIGPERGGDWGFVSAAAFPAAVRKALHEARIDGLAGPVAAEGLYYLFLKRGEVYYAFDPRPGGGMSYEILHRRNAPEGEALKQAVEGDIADYLAESRRQAYLNEAARTMGIKQVQTEIGQLEIRTDVLDEDETRILGQVVEATVRAHEDFWGPLVPLRPFSQKVQVYAWARKADHDRLHRLWLAAGGKGASGEAIPAATPPSLGPGPEVWSFTGEYIPASRILSVPCERMSGHLPVPIVIHEAIHMLDYERAYGAGVQPSKWFEEGLATYFGFSQIGSRLNIEPGDIRRSGTIVAGTVRVQFDPRTPLREYIKRIGGGEPVSLRTLLTSKAGDSLWSGDRAVLAYGASWTLVHFLIHGAKGAHRAAFGEYARAEAQGKGGCDTFVRLFGPDLVPLEEAWHKYEEDL